MKKFVDLGNHIAIIEYFETINVPKALQNEYDSAANSHNPQELDQVCKTPVVVDIRFECVTLMSSNGVHFGSPLKITAAAYRDIDHAIKSILSGHRTKYYSLGWCYDNPDACTWLKS